LNDTTVEAAPVSSVQHSCSPQRPVDLGPIGAGCAGLATAAICGALIEIVEANDGISSSALLRDPAAVYDIPVLAGAVSFVGVALLLCCFSVTLFAALILNRHRNLLAMVSGLSLILALDDQFLLHEKILPNALGISEEVVVAAYAVTGLIILSHLLTEVGWRRALGLGPVVFFLVGSVLADIAPFGIETSYATEDLLKVAGFGGWLAFWSLYSARRVKGGLTQP